MAGLDTGHSYLTDDLSSYALLFIFVFCEYSWCRYLKHVHFRLIIDACLHLHATLNNSLSTHYCILDFRIGFSLENNLIYFIQEEVQHLFSISEMGLTFFSFVTNKDFNLWHLQTSLPMKWPEGRAFSLYHIRRIARANLQYWNLAETGYLVWHLFVSRVTGVDAEF